MGKRLNFCQSKGVHVEGVPDLPVIVSQPGPITVLQPGPIIIHLGPYTQSTWIILLGRIHVDPMYFRYISYSLGHVQLVVPMSLTKPMVKLFLWDIYVDPY